MLPPTPAAPPTVPTTAPEPKPKTFAGPVLIRIFTEVIATGGEGAAPKSIDDKKREVVETALGRVPGVGSVTFKPEDRIFEAEYSGPYDKLSEFKAAMSTTGVASEMVSPLEILFRPASVPVSDPKKLIASLESVPGVAAAVQEGHLFKCYGAIDVDLAAIEKAGGTVESHAWIELVLKTPMNDRGLSELLQVKYVLAVEPADGRVRALTVKGRATRAALKSTLARCGVRAE
jgi:copper chaperone CopZ